LLLTLSLFFEDDLSKMLDARDRSRPAPAAGGDGK
jgi:hypothetical protein